MQDAVDLLEHDEWGECLSLVCTQLYEYDIAINRNTFESIQRIGKLMQMSPKEWENLENLVT